MTRLSKNIRKLYARQGLLVILAAVLLVEATGLVQVLYMRKTLREEADSRARSELVIHRLQIEKITESVSATCESLSGEIEMSLSSPDTIPFLLTRALESNPMIVSSAVGFAENYYPGKGLWFEPLVARRGDGSFERMVLGSESHDYFRSEWYTRATGNGAGGWSEPYFDESGAKTTVVTYSVPIIGRDGKIAGVIATDISLGWLESLVKSIQSIPGSRTSVTSGKGIPLTGTLDEIPAKCLTFDTTMDGTGWKMTTIIPEESVYAGMRNNSRLVGLLQLLGILFLAFIVQRSIKVQSRLDATRAEADRIESELQVASAIQKSMIPKTFPPFPERDDLDLAAMLVPAKEVGGDLYDYFIRDDKLFFCVGDVSGKGTPASLVMAVTRSLFRTVAGREDSPGAIVSAMNQSMTDMNENDMFVTFFCGYLNLSNGLLKYCDAGHNPPVILTDKKTRLDVIPNLPLGVIPDFAYKEQEIRMYDDDALFLYTDGVTEAENASHELFGEKRMMDALSGRKPSQKHLDNIKKVVGDFVGDAPQSDDMTMLFIHFMNKEAKHGTRFHLVLDNDIQRIPELHDFICCVAEEADLGESLTANLNLAMEEAVTNVIMYAYPAGVKGEVRIDASVEDGRLRFTISDNGVAFDPTLAPEADITSDVEDREVGGLGIHLIRAIMDSVTYSRLDGVNQLDLTKNI